jgi:hypothetical protein
MKPRVPFTVSHSLDTHFEQVLLYAVELLQEMDWTIPYGIVPVAPDVLVWMIGKYEPEVVYKLRDEGKLGEFKSRLRQFARVRAEAAVIQNNEHTEAEAEISCQLQDLGHLEPSHILKALDTGTLRKVDRIATTLFKRVVSAAYDRQSWMYSHRTELEDEAPRGVARKWHKPRDVFLDCDAEQRCQPTHLATDPNDAPALSFALSHAKELMVAGDIGQRGEYWDKAYSQVVGEWIAHDLPDVSAELLARNQVDRFFQCANAFIVEQRRAEQIWYAMSAQLRFLVLSHVATIADAKRIIRSVVRATEQAETDEEMERLTTLVLEMMERRAEPPTLLTECPTWRTHETCPVFQRARSEPDTSFCYLAEVDDLPADLRTQTSESHCLVVRLPNERVIELPALSRAHEGGIQCVCVEQKGQPVTYMMAISDAFWCNEPVFLEVIHRFRAALPVIYLLESGEALFVEYPFGYFGVHANIREQDLHLVHRFDGENLSCRPGMPRPTNSPDPIAPLLITTIVDMTSRQRDKSLADEYVKRQQETEMSQPRM